jgi:integrase
MLYASRTRHGIWRYRRAIPGPLRNVAGRREYVVSLETRDDDVAARRHAKVHLEAERQFKLWRAEASGVPVRTSEEDEWSKGVQFLKRNGLDYIPLGQMKVDHESSANPVPSIFEERLNFIANRLGIEVENDETRDEAINGSLEARAVLGDLRRPVLRLSGALRIYLDEKAADLSRMSERSARGFCLERQRVIVDLQRALGEDKPITSLTRGDARLYRDHLIERQVAASTVNKYIRIAHGVIGTAISDRDLNIQNPFRSLRVSDETPDIEKRHPLSTDETKVLLGSKARINDELAAIIELLVCTGARLSEIAGLEIADVQPQRTSESPPYLWIRPNRTRPLKNVSSRRRVPLVGSGVQTATDALAKAASAGQTEGPLFPRYGRNGGADAASQALMKFLRKIGITDRRKVVHSIRHSVKQGLRDVGCPKDIRDAIQGHSAGDVAETYGSGHGVSLMAEWLEKAVRGL